MEYLHTMVRVTDLRQSLDFYVNKLGLVETRRMDNEAGRYTLVFLAAPGDPARPTPAAGPGSQRNCAGCLDRSGHDRSYRGRICKLNR